MFNSESDNDELMPKVLPVDDNEDDVDFSVPPTSGQEYLKRVIKEAKNCPDTVVAAVSYSILSRKQHKPLHVPLCSRLHPAPQGYAPSSSWQKQQVADFAAVRQKLADYKECMKIGAKSETVVPLKENVNAWCALCFGRLGVDRLTRNSPTLLDDKTSDGSATSCARFLSSEGGTPPLLSIVTGMDQPTVVKVLEYHINWFEKTGFSVEQGRWFYALLACLEKPLDPDACFLIRTLARHCASLRATLESTSDPRLVVLNLLICLVSRCFDQLDLGDDAS